MTKTQRFSLLRQLPCCECGKRPIQVAHSNFSEHGKGKGIKADDSYTIPLCHSCHRSFDVYDMGMSREASKAWFLDKLEMVNATINTDTRETAF